MRAGEHVKVVQGIYYFGPRVDLIGQEAEVIFVYPPCSHPRAATAIVKFPDGRKRQCLRDEMAAPPVASQPAESR